VGALGLGMGVMGYAMQAEAKEAVEITLKSDDQPTFDDMKIFSGTANLPLSQEIAAELGVQLGDLSVKTYADGEIGIQIHENVRGKDIYIIQPTCPPGVNDNLMELILLVSTMRRASARKITAVIPYFGYARQDRKMQSRVPISAADVCRLLEAMGVDRVVAVDLHCGQIQGFFSPRTPCDNLEGSVVALPYFRGLDIKSESTSIASPDAGGVHRAKQFRDRLKKRAGIDAGLAMIIKQRLKANAIERMDLVGHVDGCDVILVDDMIDTAGTLTKAATELKERGANRVFAYATHGLFNGPAISRINSSDLEQVVVCNTVPLNASAQQCNKIKMLSIAELLSEAIARIHFKQSVSALFKK
jgi:ribose-phosphate pyrophosphokinase